MKLRTLLAMACLVMAGLATPAHAVDTIGLFELDMNDGSFGEAIFIRDDVDITDVLFDYKTGELIAAVVSEIGMEGSNHPRVTEKEPMSPAMKTLRGTPSVV